MTIGLTAFYSQRIAREEARLGETLDLLREMLKASPAMVTRMFMAFPLFTYRREAPSEVMDVARLAALRAEDCGPCVMTQVAHARKAGTPEEIIRHTALGDFDALDGDLRIVARFADGIVRSADDVAELGDRIEERFGRDIRTELALAAGSVRFYPAMKRGLGMAESCAILRFDD